MEYFLQQPVFIRLPTQFCTCTVIRVSTIRHQACDVLLSCLTLTAYLKAHPQCCDWTALFLNTMRTANCQFSSISATRTGLKVSYQCYKQNLDNHCWQHCTLFHLHTVVNTDHRGRWMHFWRYTQHLSQKSLDQSKNAIFTWLTRI